MIFFFLPFDRGEHLWDVFDVRRNKTEREMMEESSSWIYGKCQQNQKELENSNKQTEKKHIKTFHLHHRQKQSINVRTEGLNLLLRISHPI